MVNFAFAAFPVSIKSVRLRTTEMMGKHYGLFTDRIEAVVPVRSAEEITAAIEEKLQQFLLPEAS